MMSFYNLLDLSYLIQPLMAYSFSSFSSISVLQTVVNADFGIFHYSYTYCLNYLISLRVCFCMSPLLGDLLPQSINI